MWVVTQVKLKDDSAVWSIKRFQGCKNWVLFRQEKHRKENQQVGNFSSLILAKECAQKYTKSFCWEITELLAGSKKTNITWKIRKNYWELGNRNFWDVVIDNRGLETFHDECFRTLSEAKRFIEKCEGC